MARLTGPALALAAGLLMALGLAPFSFYWAPVLGLGVVFARVARLGRARAVLGHGYLFGLGYAGLGVYWIYHSIADYGGGPVAAVLATGILVALFALIPMIALFIGWWAGAGRAGRRALLALPLAWLLVEWVRSWLFTGATWLSVGYSQIDTPLAHFAPLFGVYGPGLVVALLGGTLAWWLLRPRSARIALPLGATLGVTVIGVVLERDWTRPVDEPVTVAMLQGNIAQDRKWDPDERGAILAEYLRMSRAEFGQDLIVWPETALPVFYHQGREWLDQLAEQAAAAGSSIVLGAPVAAEDGLYNAVAVPGETPQFYYKRHLVPFGEYVPFRDVAGGVLDFVGTPLGDFNAGTRADPLQAAGHALGVSICYEVTFGDEVADALPAAEILLNVSNDAWFGASTAPWQHLQMARMRALETGRPMIRATNTGISALIDAKGRVQVRGPLFERTVVRGSVQPHAGTTPYLHWRDWPMALLALAGTGLLLVLRWREAWPHRRR
ncbi:apolipoprotein N-acyltransferase [Spiribacter insolitus]|uniref:Apolipoprotein N-acyltransferase n=1 Tax=Spiribacter insolitus TaxID=3122417 RepID=A0ABV3T3T4_9GAMM